MTAPIEEAFLARFESELDITAFGDPTENLSYTDRQLLKDGKHVALAREKLPETERAIWWEKAVGGFGAVLLALGGIWSLLAFLEVVSATTPFGEIGALFFYVTFMGLAAIGRLWKLPGLERRRLLCELVIARDAALKTTA